MEFIARWVRGGRRSIWYTLRGYWEGKDGRVPRGKEKSWVLEKGKTVVYPEEKKSRGYRREKKGSSTHCVGTRKGKDGRVPRENEKRKLF